MSDRLSDVGRLVGFATLGVLTTTQELCSSVLSEIEGVDPANVAEETLALLSVLSCRAAESALADNAVVRTGVAAALADLPLLYSDYVAGEAVITQTVRSEEDARVLAERIERKRVFYLSHVPEGQFPSGRLLLDKMELWMGRISVPGLPGTPRERLDTLGLVDPVSTHLKLVLGFSKHL